VLFGIPHHLSFVHDRPFMEIVNAPDIAGQQTEAFEPPAIKRAVFVEKRHRCAELLILNRNEFVT
jgi:hypothetical protein